MATDGHLHRGERARAGRYAALAQEAGLSPIVEPEVLMDGDHDLERCAEVTERRSGGVRPARPPPGRARGHAAQAEHGAARHDCADQADDDDDRERDVEVCADTVPAAVPGIVFLSGGQTDEQATARLDAINRRQPQPWELSFSFGRALQAPALHAPGPG